MNYNHYNHSCYGIFNIDIDNYGYNSIFIITIVILVSLDVIIDILFFILVSFIWNTNAETTKYSSNSTSFNGRLVKTLKNHTYAIWTTAILPNGNLVTGSWDNSINIWNITNNNGSLVNKLIGHSSYIMSLAVLSNDKLASSTRYSELFIWNLKTNSILYKLPTSLYSIMRLAVLPLNGNLVAGAYSNQIEIWNTTNGSLVFKLTNPKKTLKQWIYEGGFRSFALLDDNKILAIGSYNIDLWNPYNATYIGSLNHTKQIWSMITLSNNRLAVGAQDGQITIWNTKTMKLIYNLTSHNECVIALTNNNNNKSTDDWLASGSYDNTVKIWNLKNGSLVYTLRNHKNMISSLITLENGLVVSGSYDWTANVWDPKSGQLVYTLNNHTSYVYDVRSLSNGFLATASKDGTVKIWK